MGGILLIFINKLKDILPRYHVRRSSISFEFCGVLYRDCVCPIAPLRENAPYVLPQQRRKSYLHSEGNLRIKLTFRFGCEGLAIYILSDPTCKEDPSLA